MKNRKIYLLVLMLLVCILSISAISATEDTANKDIINVDNNIENNLETSIQYDDVSNSKENVELTLEENKNNDKEGQSQKDETTTEGNAELSFKDLNTTINGNTNSTIYLSNNYKYNNATDYNFELKGIQISRNLTIYGNGVTLNGNNMSRMFNVTDLKLNVNFYNINFINGYADDAGAIYGGNAYYCNFTGNNVKNEFLIGTGGAIYLCNAYNCTFTNNTARQGGAMISGDAYNCTFINNIASSAGGAMWSGNAYNCSFMGNTANYGGALAMTYAYNCTFLGNNATAGGGAIYFGSGAIFCTFNGDTTVNTRIIPAIINVLNYTSTYGSGERLKFNLTADNKLYDGFNTTIKIYKDGSLVKTVYALTGEGWVVDLNGGTYTAVLSLTDYPEEKPSNASITVNEGLTFTELNTIINDNTNSTIYLSDNFKYDSALDINFKEGIPISRNLTIYGNGATIDGNNIARIFNVTNPNLNVNFYNINFINGNATSGGAIYYGNAYYCNFTENHANCYDSSSGSGGAIYMGNAYNCNFNGNYINAYSVYGTPGGAIYKGNAYNCTFTGNHAIGGAAIGEGDAYNCTFTNNNATTDGGAICEGNAYNCTFTGNTAGYNGGAMYDGDAYNCTFIGNNATVNGGAMYDVNAYNCTFTGNTATENGGAMYGGNAYNSTFTDNTATNGGAIYGTYAFNSTFHGNNATENGGGMCNGTSLFCTFNGDTVYHSTIIPAIINVSNYSSSYGSGKKLEFNLTANGTVYNGFNTTIDIYQNGTLLKTVYALTGEGWTVDLNSGVYTAVLKLTDYPEEKPSNATIIIKENTTVVITPITNATIGQEVTINYTTNSNGTVTIKVNNQTITGNKFTPEKPGTYNITVEIAETEYYAGASSETSFTIPKTNTTVEISPITNVTLGQEVTINVTTNSNGTVTIKVNNQTITGNKFTPEKPGTYNITVEIAENDYYTGASSETSFTIPKTNTTVEISPITNVTLGQEVTINVTTNSNGTVTIKVNGQVINGTKFTPTIPGTYNLTVEIAENDYYEGATSETTFNVSKANTTVIIKPIGDVPIGEEMKINYTTNSNGTVTIKVNNQTITGNKFTPQTVGIYNLTVEIAANDYYTGATYETTFKAVEEIATKITAKPVTTTYYKSKIFTITLKDANGKPISGAVLTVKLDGTKKYKTNKNGQVKIQVGALTPKTYNVKITYAGSKKYKKSTTSVKIPIKKATPKITANAVKYNGKNKQFKVYFLTDHMKYHALKNKEVTLKVNGKTYKVKTNSKGQGVFNINTLKKGKYTAVLTVPANSCYNKVTRNVVINVKK